MVEYLSNVLFTISCCPSIQDVRVCVQFILSSLAGFKLFRKAGLVGVQNGVTSQDKVF